MVRQVGGKRPNVQSRCRAGAARTADRQLHCGGRLDHTLRPTQTLLALCRPTPSLRTRFTGQILRLVLLTETFAAYSGLETQTRANEEVCALRTLRTK